jgi:Arc/MetJ-type ribon-helix-helix transcriptional regulator
MPKQENKMKLVSISLPEKQVEKIDGFVESGEYPNRSEVIRTAMREFNEHHQNTVSVQSPVVVAS